MPRKRKKRSGGRIDDDSASKIFIFMFFAVFALALVALLAGWIVCEAVGIRFRRVKAFSYFALRPDEQEALTGLYERYIPIRRARSALLERGKNTAKRADGLFDERSKLGRDLNQQLVKIDPQYESLRQEIEQIRDLPYSRLHRFESWLHHRRLFRFGMALMAAISVSIYFALPAFAAKFGHVFISKLPQIAIYSSDQTVGAIFIATCIAAAFVAFASAFTQPKEIKLIGSEDDFQLKTAYDDARMMLGEY